MPPESLETTLALKPSSAAGLRKAAYAALELDGVSLPPKKLSNKAIRAILHAASGIAVVPYHGFTSRGCTCGKPECSSPGKHPVFSDWPKLATVDLATVVGWWQAHPQANIAGVVGTDLLVLDIDDRNGGFDSLDDLVDLHGELPETPTSLTGGGGAHYIFRNTFPPSTKTKTGAKPGIDILVGAHAFVLPGSTHASGSRYEWAPGFEYGDVELADPPEWLVALLTSHSGTDSANAVESVGEAFVEGHRNTELFKAASKLVRAGFRGDDLQLLMFSYNDSRCVPPLGDQEVFRLATSAESRGPAPAKQDRMRVLSRSALAKLPKPEFLVEGVLLEKSMTMMWGDSNVGKTFVALHLSACVATGAPFFGHATNPGHVLYVIAEGQGSFNSRVLAWERLNKAQLGGKVSFVDSAVQLHDDASVDRLSELIAAEDIAPVLVVIDTLARCFVGKDENSSRDAGLLVAGCQRLQEELGCAVLLLHHCGKGDKATYRGSSAFEGALDTIVSLERVPHSETDVVLRCRKQREAPYFADVRAELVPMVPSAAIQQGEGPTRFGDSSADDSLILSELTRLYQLSGLPVRFNDLLAATQFTRSTFVRRLRVLAETDEIVKLTEGGYLPSTADCGTSLVA